MASKYDKITSPLHESWGGWKNFLLNHCEKRDEVKKVIFYGSVNCNYILFPCGFFVENYGYHGKALMNKIRKEGKKSVKSEIQENRNKIDKLLNKLN